MPHRVQHKYRDNQFGIEDAVTEAIIKSRALLKSKGQPT